MSLYDHIMVSNNNGVITAMTQLGEPDIHTAKASEIYGCTPEEVTDKQRQAAKSLNYMEIYGTSTKGVLDLYKGNNESIKSMIKEIEERLGLDEPNETGNSTL